MIVEETSIKDCFLISPAVHTDERGYFFEFYNKKRFIEATGLEIDFVQDNQAYSEGKVWRGLHFQKGNAAQAKLVSVQQGIVQDVVVDLRKDSPSYSRVVTIMLSDANKNQLYVPRGCAHGYLTLSEQVLFCYKCDNYYAPELEAGLSAFDANLSIEWEASIEDARISEKDRALPLWKDCYKF